MVSTAAWLRSQHVGGSLVTRTAKGWKVGEKHGINGIVGFGNTSSSLPVWWRQTISNIIRCCLNPLRVVFHGIPKSVLDRKATNSCLEHVWTEALVHGKSLRTTILRFFLMHTVICALLQSSRCGSEDFCHWQCPTSTPKSHGCLYMSILKWSHFGYLCGIYTYIYHNPGKP